MSEASDTEVFRQIPDHPGYRVSNMGRVQSRRKRGAQRGFTNTWRDVKPQPGKRGHLMVDFWIKGKRFQRYVHRLVLEAFVGPCPEGMEACHFPDRDPSNNRLENLRWDTHAANCQDSRLHGTMRVGSRCYNAKRTEADVLEMRELSRQGVSQNKIAARFHTDQGSVSAIVHYKMWKHVP